MRVRAITKIYYSKREYQPGETYAMDDREEQEAKILHALGKIEILDLPIQPKVKAPEYKTRAVEPEKQQEGPMTTENTDALTPGRSPRYRRRDMRPQS